MYHWRLKIMVMWSLLACSVDSLSYHAATHQRHNAGNLNANNEGYSVVSDRLNAIHVLGNANEVSLNAYNAPYTTDNASYATDNAYSTSYATDNASYATDNAYSTTYATDNAIYATDNANLHPQLNVRRSRQIHRRTQVDDQTRRGEVKSMTQQVVVINFTAELSKVNPYQPLVTGESEDEGTPLTDEDWSLAEELLDLQHDTAADSDGLRNPTTDVLAQDQLFEGDIVITSSQELVNAFMVTRNAIVDNRKMWPKGVVPYAVSSKFTKAGRAAIAAGIVQFHRSSCVKFIPYQQGTHTDYIFFIASSTCSSSVGRQGKKQLVRLSKACLSPGVVAHELMHVLGFWHEQARADRDNHVTIVWDNIPNDKRQNFARRTTLTAQDFGAPYDYGSVMHYSWNHFAKDPTSPTIITKQPGAIIGQREAPSPTDIFKVNALYSCAAAINNPGLPVGQPKPNLFVAQPPPLLTTDQPPPPLLVITSTPGDKCEDVASVCKVWAAGGQCTVNPSWMNNNCPRACGRCDINLSCLDKLPFCDYWTKKGECQINPKYMLKNCKSSCKQC
ncbi:zinc metalloproteinase nas-7-like isoform X2 [Homarus americanus]|uniref:zinc metalloproteinase nas-7-like isoform X2 n=1 Tax=Homarus americanus TaxID=6706 RepID=UPI001C463E92|nr:zinc metalloproteinase nas-7-like isoform X2 [Homarus americanus]